MPSHLELAARDSDDDKPIRKLRGHRDRKAFVEIDHLSCPDYRAGTGVEGHENVIEPAHKHFTVPESHPAIVPAATRGNFI